MIKKYIKISLLDEHGSMSLIALALLMVAVVFGVGSARLAYSAWQLTNEQVYETELRLVAESGIEAGVNDLINMSVSRPTIDLAARGIQPMHEVVMPAQYNDKIKLNLYYEIMGDMIQLTAIASQVVDSDISTHKDNSSWQRAKRVRALLQRRGDNYAWVRWLP